MAYRAEIQIGVVGIGQLGTLQKSLNQVATTVDLINKKRVDAGFNIQNINTYNAQLEKAWQNINKAVMGSKEELKAVNDLVRAKQNQISAQERLNQLIAKEEAAQRRISVTANAGFGVQGPKLPAAKGGGMVPKKGLQAPGVMDAILGAGFPMLFGGGPGAVLGGGAGGLIGGAMGGMAGMALSVGLSAVGQQLDASVVKVKAMGDAINAIDTSALRESFIVVNSELDTTVRRLIEAGEIDKARAALAAEVAAQTGASTQAISGITNKTQELFTAWDRFTSAVSTTAGIVATPLLDGITGVLNIISLAAQGANTLLSLFAQAGPILERSLTPLLPFVGIFRFLANKVSEAMPKGVNEEVQKRNAALEEETDNRMYNLVLMGKQEQIDKRRNRGNTVAAQIQNNELDRQEKINDLVAKRDKDLRAARKQFAGTDNQQLAVLEKQIQVEFKLNQRLVEREALRKRERLESEQITNSLKAQLEVLSNVKAIEDARSQAKQQILSADIQGLQLQKQFALSLNEESVITDKIASKKIDAANESYTQTTKELQSKVEQLAIELQITEAAYTRGDATEKQVQQAKDNLQTAVTVRDELLKGAEATRSQAVAAADLERRQQNVAAFAADAARQTEAFNRAANEATNALNNRLKVSDALTQAALTVNNIEIQSLQSKLAQAETEQDRVKILDAIRDLEIANAALTLQATRTQIQAEVERQRIAMSMAEVKYKELQAVVQLAAAQKVLTQSHLEALRAQASALQIARDNYATSVKVADAQMMAANAVYNASVNAANLRVQMEGTASAAGAVAGAMDRVAASSGGGGGGFLTAENIKNPILRARAEESLAEIDKRTPRTGGVLAILKALSDKQDVVLDYMRIERRAAYEQQLQSAAQELEGMGLGRYVPSQYRSSGRDSLFSRYGSMTSAAGTASASPQVNITTGPVMQMDGTNYVTQRDLVSATGTAARQGAKMALEMLQNNPSSRRSTGVTR